MQFPRQELPPPLAQCPQPRVDAEVPVGHADQERPLREPHVLVQMVQRVSWKQIGLAIDEEFLQGQIDGTYRAVVVDGTEQVAPHGNEPLQGRKTPFVNR